MMPAELRDRFATPLTRLPSDPAPIWQRQVAGVTKDGEGVAEPTNGSSS